MKSAYLCVIDKNTSQEFILQLLHRFIETAVVVFFDAWCIFLCLLVVLRETVTAVTLKPLE